MAVGSVADADAAANEMFQTNVKVSFKLLLKTNKILYRLDNNY